MRFWTIDEALVHEGESDPESILSNSFDFLVRGLFPFQKLSARESNYLKAVLLIPVKELCKLPVVFLGGGSLRGYVDDDSTLLVLHEVSKSVRLQVNVLDFNLPKFALIRQVFGYLLSPLRRPKANAVRSISHRRDVCKLWPQKELSKINTFY